MPKPKGWSDAMLQKRDKCVQDLLAKGYQKSKAYAICTAAQEKKSH